MARFTLQVVSKMIVLREHGPFAHIEIPAADRPTPFATELHDELNPDCREHGGRGASCSQCCGPCMGASSCAPCSVPRAVPTRSSRTRRSPTDASAKETDHCAT